jgi:hypothetical protein
MSIQSLTKSAIVACWLILYTGPVVLAEDKVLFDFAEASGTKDWAPVKLPELKADQPAPKLQIAPAGDAPANAAPAAGKCLKITFDGGDWPAIATTKIPVEGNWKPYETLKADLTVDRPSVAWFRVCQGKSDPQGKQPRWEKTMILAPGRNEVVLTIRRGLGLLDPGRGDVTSFVIGMFQPEKGQSLLVSNVRLSTDWPAPHVTDSFLAWYSPYNHDGYSAAVAREYQRTGAMTRFKVLGTDLEVGNSRELAATLKDKWTMPEPKSIEQVEAEFKVQLDKIRQGRPKAIGVTLRDGEKGWDPGAPEKIYAGWKVAYLSCHGPDGPNPGRERTGTLYDTVEAFMRHRSPLMQADLSSIPKDATILAARLVITRALAADMKPPSKPNLWVAEPCNRDWDPASANCYCYAQGKHWKAVSGLYYGEDPDYWPVFLMHGPAGGGAVSTWDFTEAVKFWFDGRHANHGFFLYGDSNDYMRMYTPKAKDQKFRPALMVIYEPKK